LRKRSSQVDIRGGINAGNFKNLATKNMAAWESSPTEQKGEETAAQNLMCVKNERRKPVVDAKGP